MPTVALLVHSLTRAQIPDVHAMLLMTSFCPLHHNPSCMQAHLHIVNVTTDALRGVVAATDIKEGEPLALLPDNLIIEMGSQRHSSAVSTCLSL